MAGDKSVALVQTSPPPPPLLFSCGEGGLYTKLNFVISENTCSQFPMSMAIKGLFFPFNLLNNNDNNNNNIDSY